MRRLRWRGGGRLAPTLLVGLFLAGVLTGSPPPSHPCFDDPPEVYGYASWDSEEMEVLTLELTAWGADEQGFVDSEPDDISGGTLVSAEQVEDDFGTWTVFWTIEPAPAAQEVSVTFRTICTYTSSACTGNERRRVEFDHVGAVDLGDVPVAPEQTRMEVLVPG